MKSAEEDLRAANDSATAGHHAWGAFQAEQCAEKGAKALVQSLHGSVRGHSITEILRHLPASVKMPEALLNAAQKLEKVHVISRYPNGFASGSPSDYFDEKSSRELISYAREILEFCRSKVH